MGIVHPYPEGIPAGVHQRADVEGKGRISALVVAGVRAVHIKVQLLVGTLETHVHPLARKVVVYRDILLVPGRPAPVSGSLVPAVGGIPGMGDGDRLDSTVSLFMEGPFIINAPFVSWSGRCGKAGQRRKER